MNTKTLIAEAEKAMSLSRSPYSNFKVGAAVLTADGKVIPGANIENSSYPLSMCAERNAIYHALLQGYQPKDLVGLAVIGNTEGPIAPCGACRQVMSELLAPGAKIVLSNLKGLTKEVSISELLPFAFTPRDLKK